MDPKQKIKLIVNKANLQHLDDYVALIADAKTPEEFETLMGSRGSYGASFNQLLGPLMMNLYYQDETVREEIQTRPFHYPIPDKFIRDYFREFIRYGAIPIHMRFEEELPAEDRLGFFEECKQVMLDEIRKYAGFKID